MIRVLAFVLTLLSWPAAAQDTHPALYDVTGVAADDMLNVRAAPTAGSEIIGAFAPFETGIEVIALSDDGGWGRVNTGEQAGWTSMRFLERQPHQTAADWAGFPPGTLRCFGTEPFWGLAFESLGSFELTDPLEGDGIALRGTYTELASSSIAKRGYFGTVDGFPTWFSAVIAVEICSDGMSDRDYGFSIDLARVGPRSGRLDVGCCSFER